MRIALLVLVVVLAAAIGVATVSDMINHGVTWIDVLACLVVVLFATGIVGALAQRPPDDR